MRVLFITRKYPPSTGGMESAAYSLRWALGRRHDVKLVAWGGSNKWLALAYPYLLLKGLLLALTRRPDVVYLQDGMLAPMAWIFHGLLRLPTVITVHGLDVTYKSSFYQFVFTRASRQADLAVAVSHATAAQFKARVAGVKCVVIGNGVNDEFFIDEPKTQLLEKLCQQTAVNEKALQNKKILLTTGRLVPRKGVSWFIAEVLPGLVKNRKDIIYLVAGTGPEAERIKSLINAKGLNDHVLLLGRVRAPAVKYLYNAADVFVMPNITVKGDMEGFGLVALEAGSCGTPVVASDLEGIKDAITPGKNGILLKPQSKDEYIENIKKLLKTADNKSKSVRRYVLSHYSWDKTADRYAKEISNIVRNRP